MTSLYVIFTDSIAHCEGCKNLAMALHVASDHCFGFCNMLNACVLSCDLSPVVEIWIILSGMFFLYLKGTERCNGKRIVGSSGKRPVQVEILGKFSVEQEAHINNQPWRGLQL